MSAREQRGNSFRYAGEMQDALTGHYYLRARFYNPQIARFTQEDTYRGDGLNLYAYVANNPIRYVDPSGYMCEDKGNVYDPNNRLIPGTPGYTTKGDPTKLGQNLLESMGIKRSMLWSGYEAQHIIPSQMSNHPIIKKKIGMDMNHHSNGIFLSQPSGSVSGLSRHRGYHKVYNDVVRGYLDKLDVNQNVTIISNFEEAQELAWTQDTSLVDTLWEFVKSSEDSEILGEIYEKKLQEEDHNIKRLFDSMDNYNECFFPSKFIEIFEEVQGDLYMCAINRLVNGNKFNFYEKVFNAYRAGGWPCGWKGNYPDGDLIVYIPIEEGE